MGGRLFLLGYAYDMHTFGYLTGRDINYTGIWELLTPCSDEGIVFFYGPDVGVIRSHTGFDLRKYCHTVNLLKVVRRELPHLPDFKLATVESYFGIARTTQQYKYDPFSIASHWNNPRKRDMIIRYNREDVLNLIRIKRKLALPRRKWLQYADE